MMKHTRLPKDNFKTQQFLHTWEFNTDCLRITSPRQISSTLTVYVSLHHSRSPQHWLSTYHFTTADLFNTDCLRITSPQQTSSTLTVYVSLHHSRPLQHWLSTYHFTTAVLMIQKLKINSRTCSQMRIVMLYYNTSFKVNAYNSYNIWNFNSSNLTTSPSLKPHLRCWKRRRKYKKTQFKKKRYSHQQ